MNFHLHKNILHVHLFISCTTPLLTYNITKSIKHRRARPANKPSVSICCSSKKTLEASLASQSQHLIVHMAAGNPCPWRLPPYLYSTQLLSLRPQSIYSWLCRSRIICGHREAMSTINVWPSNNFRNPEPNGH